MIQMPNIDFDRLDSPPPPPSEDDECKRCGEHMLFCECEEEDDE